MRLKLHQMLTSADCYAFWWLLQGGDLYTALRHHAETMRWDRLGRKVALDVALGLNYLHAQVRAASMHSVDSLH